MVLDNTAIYRIMTDNLMTTSANPQQINQLVRTDGDGAGPTPRRAERSGLHTVGSDAGGSAVVCTGRLRP